MKCKIDTPAPWLPKSLNTCARNLIALINGHPNVSNKCIPAEFIPEIMIDYDRLLSSINHCLILLKKDECNSTRLMWQKFDSNGYDCVDIFFKIVRCYYEIANFHKYHKKYQINKTKLEQNLDLLRKTFEYLKNAEDIELLDEYDHGPYYLTKDSPEYSKIFDENGNFIHEEQDVYYHREDYRKFLHETAVIFTKMQNNINYKLSNRHSLLIDCLYTGTRREKDFDDKSLIMTKMLYLLFYEMFNRPYTTPIKTIVKLLFPLCERDDDGYNDIFRNLSKRIQKLKKDIEENGFAYRFDTSQLEETLATQ